MVTDSLQLGVRRAFAVSRSHYENIDLGAMGESFAPGYSHEDLAKIKEEVGPLAQPLSGAAE